MDVFKDHVTEENGKVRFQVDKFIPKMFFKPVMYACKMMYKGMPFDFAVSKASDCYGIDENFIIQYLPEYTKQLLREEIPQ